MSGPFDGGPPWSPPDVPSVRYFPEPLPTGERPTGNVRVVRLGVHLPYYTLPGGPPALAGVLRDVGRACDDAGVDVLSLIDHFFGMPFMGPVEAPVLEGYTTLGFLAAATRDVELQLLVTGVTYRHPGVLAKVVSTLDVLSGGRATLGIGAGWYEAEHRGLGIPFPPLRDRFELLEEALQILRQMWSHDDGGYAGKHYTLDRTLNSPQPLHRVPVMIGGVGERKTLRIVARYADACNFFAGGDSGVDFVAGKLAVLREHCEREGTSYDEIRKTIAWSGQLDPARPAEFLEAMAAMAEVGVEEVHVVPSEDDPVGFVRTAGEHLVPGLAGVGR
jgi:F420-dependent oxidoreductase-like protein